MDMEDKTAINMRFIVNAPIEQVWDALTNAETIEKWSGQEARMDDQPETEFALFGGDIYGRNVEVHSPQFLKQEFLYSSNFDIQMNAARSIIKHNTQHSRLMIEELMETSQEEHQLIIKHCQNPLIRF